VTRKTVVVVNSSLQSSIRGTNCNTILYLIANVAFLKNVPERYNIIVAVDHVFIFFQLCSMENQIINRPGKPWNFTNYVFIRVYRDRYMSFITNIININFESYWKRLFNLFSKYILRTHSNSSFIRRQFEYRGFIF